MLSLQEGMTRIEDGDQRASLRAPSPQRLRGGEHLVLPEAHSPVGWIAIADRKDPTTLGLQVSIDTAA